MVSNEELQERFDKVSRLITDFAISNEEVQRAVKEFAALEADEGEKEKALDALHGTLECRSSQHLPRPAKQVKSASKTEGRG